MIKIHFTQEPQLTIKDVMIRHTTLISIMLEYASSISLPLLYVKDIVPTFLKTCDTLVIPFHPEGPERDF